MDRREHKRYLSVAEAARELRVSPQSIYRAVDESALAERPAADPAPLHRDVSTAARAAPMEVAVSTAPFARAGKVRDRVIRGVGKLTPTKSFRWRGEEFVARRTRIGPEHDVCRDPEAAALLVPCWSEETAPAVIEILERTGRSWVPVEAGRTAEAARPGRPPMYGVDYARPRRRRDESWRRP